VLFPLINSKSTLLLTLAVVVGQGIVHAAMYGPLAALYTELFSTHTRYTGASLGYQISGIGAGLAPVAFASVLAAGGGTVMVSIIIAVFCLLSVACIVALRETASADLTVDPDSTAAVPAMSASR
jgi:MFS family permease